MGPRAGLNRCGNLAYNGIRSPDRPVRTESLHRLSYPGPRSPDNSNNYHVFRTEHNISQGVKLGADGGADGNWLALYKICVFLWNDKRREGSSNNSKQNEGTSAKRV